MRARTRTRTRSVQEHRPPGAPEQAIYDTSPGNPDTPPSLWDQCDVVAYFAIEVRRWQRGLWVHGPHSAQQQSAQQTKRARTVRSSGAAQRTRDVPGGPAGRGPHSQRVCMPPWAAPACAQSCVHADALLRWCAQDDVATAIGQALGATGLDQWDVGGLAVEAVANEQWVDQIKVRQPQACAHARARTHTPLRAGPLHAAGSVRAPAPQPSPLHCARVERAPPD